MYDVSSNQRLFEFWALTPASIIIYVRSVNGLKRRVLGDEKLGRQ